MATLTSTGINCSNGTLDGYYTGTDSQNSTVPIGSVVFAYNYSGSPPASGTWVNSTIPYIKYETRNIAQRSLYYVSATASVANYGNLAGTWRSRGGAVNGCDGTLTLALAQRVA